MVKKAARQLLGSSLFFKFILKQQQFLPSHIYYVLVDPKDVSHISLIPENSCRLSGPKAAYGAFVGSFDMIKKPFEKNPMYRTVEQLISGECGDSTPHFKKLVKNDGENKAIAQLKKLENLIVTLSNDGYLSQYELGNTDITRKIGALEVPRHETIIGMDRNGKLFRIKGGKHRLAIAQNIDIPAIPAILTLYHQNAVDMLPYKRREITGVSNDFRPF